jgi:hypothetical protein
MRSHMTRSVARPVGSSAGSRPSWWSYLSEAGLATTLLVITEIKS